MNKKLLVGIILIGVLLISVPVAEASWWDDVSNWFDNLFNTPVGNMGTSKGSLNENKPVRISCQDSCKQAGYRVGSCRSDCLISEDLNTEGYCPSSLNGLSSIDSGNKCCCSSTQVSPQGNCLSEGEYVSNLRPLNQDMNLVCCQGLDLLRNPEYFNSECFEVSPQGQEVFDEWVCSDCGNGNCEAWENKCNCPSDCDITPVVPEEFDSCSNICLNEGYTGSKGCVGLSSNCENPSGVQGLCNDYNEGPVGECCCEDQEETYTSEECEEICSAEGYETGVCKDTPCEMGNREHHLGLCESDVEGTTNNCCCGEEKPTTPSTEILCEEVCKENGMKFADCRSLALSCGKNVQLGSGICEDGEEGICCCEPVPSICEERCKYYGLEYSRCLIQPDKETQQTTDLKCDDSIEKDLGLSFCFNEDSTALTSAQQGYEKGTCCCKEPETQPSLTCQEICANEGKNYDGCYDQGHACSDIDKGIVDTCEDSTINDPKKCCCEEPSSPGPGSPGSGGGGGSGNGGGNDWSDAVWDKLLGDDIICGDGICDENELCAQDCRQPEGSICGDGICEPGELQSCSQDCLVEPYCGDGFCDQTENAGSCPEDCIKEKSSLWWLWILIILIAIALLITGIFYFIKKKKGTNKKIVSSSKKPILKKPMDKQGKKR